MSLSPVMGKVRDSVCLDVDQTLLFVLLYLCLLLRFIACLRWKIHGHFAMHLTSSLIMYEKSVPVVQAQTDLSFSLMTPNAPSRFSISFTCRPSTVSESFSSQTLVGLGLTLPVPTLTQHLLFLYPPVIFNPPHKLARMCFHLAFGEPGRGADLLPDKTALPSPPTRIATCWFNGS